MKYEVMAVASNSLSKSDAEKFCKDQILKRIKDEGGNVTFDDFWGERGFAYRIKGEKWGYYFVSQFEMDSDPLLELKEEWRINPNLVRFLVTKVNPKAPEPRTYESIKSEWAAQEKEAKLKEMDTPKKAVSSREVAVSEAPKAEEASPKKATKKAEKETAKKEEPPKEASKDEVDKKLDAILEDSSLDL